MAETGLLSLLVKNKDAFNFTFPPITNEQIAVLTFQIVTKLSHEMHASVTSSPVEKGSSIADHVVLDNKRATFEIVISDTPLFWISSIAGAAVSELADKVRAIPSENIIARQALTAGMLFGSNIAANQLSRLNPSLLDKSTKAKGMFEILEQLRDQRTLITAQLGYRQYTNAVITALSMTQEGKDALTASITIEEVHIVTTSAERIDATQCDKSVEHTAPDVQNAGKQETVAVSDNRTWFKRLVDALRGKS
jgi:hypothetical protein